MSHGIDLRVGDCLDVFGAEPDASLDAYVSDWPAGVAFMGRAWDKAHGGRDAWVRAWAERAAMMRRKAKPGAYALTWALPRTQHWTATALDDAGWVIQDVITHVFGQGWPKGRSALKPASECWILARNGGGGALQIDAARVARGAGEAGTKCSHFPGPCLGHGASNSQSGPTVHVQGEEVAGSWPPNFMLSHCEACEERGVRRVASGVLHPFTRSTTPPMSAAGGPGQGTAIKGRQVTSEGYSTDGSESVPAFDCLAACDCGLSRLAPAGGAAPRCVCGAGMWWACAVALMDVQSGDRPSGARAEGVRMSIGYGGNERGDGGPAIEASNGGASRFFPCFQYMAKSAGGERHAGCDDLYWRRDASNPFGFARVTREEWEAIGGGGSGGLTAGADNRPGRELPEASARGNVHPTVKSIALMERLVALVTPPGGRVGDVTLGSGGTAIALHRLNVARGLGASLLGCDICPEAIAIAEARLAWWRSVRHDTKPVKHDAASQASDPRQVTIFDMLGGR